MRVKENNRDAAITEVRDRLESCRRIAYGRRGPEARGEDVVYLRTFTRFGDVYNPS